MIFLVISILASSMINIVIRLSQGKAKAKISMLAFNYLTCTCAAMYYTGVGNALPKSAGINVALMLGCINGFIYLSTLVLQELCIKKNGVVLPSVFSRIGSLMIPFFVSVIFFGERPVAAQIIGAIIAVGAIIAMNYRNEKESVGSMLLLLVLFVSDGCASVMSKVYGELGSAEFSSHFLLYTFATALLVSIVFIIARKERPGWYEALFGVLIGVPNYFASRFLLRALNTVPAVIAYPIRSIGSIMVISLAGIFLFRERLKKNQWYAVGAILVAVVLLSM